MILEKWGNKIVYLVTLVAQLWTKYSAPTLISASLMVYRNIQKRYKKNKCHYQLTSTFPYIHDDKNIIIELASATIKIEYSCSFLP